MKLGKTGGLALLTVALLAALAGCQKQEGPAEQAGKAMDEAVEKVGKDVDKAATKAGEEMENAGENIQDAAKADKK